MFSGGNGLDDYDDWDWMRGMHRLKVVLMTVVSFLQILTEQMQ